MMRRATWLWLAFVLGLGFALFQLKYQVQGLEERLARINREILQNEEAIHVLKAEWSYLDQPARIEALARKHLGFQPFSSKQYGTFDDLPMRTLPAPPLSNDAAPTNERAPAVGAPAVPTSPLPIPHPKFEHNHSVTLARDVQ